MKAIPWVLAAAIILVCSLPPAQAADTKVIVLNVTKSGLVSSDIPISAEKTISLRKGTRVKLVFKYADKTHAAAHKFLLNSQSTEMTTPLLNAESRDAVIEFIVGSKNERFYRLSCLVPCQAMDYLVDYVILVDKLQEG